MCDKFRRINCYAMSVPDCGLVTFIPYFHYSETNYMQGGGHILCMHVRCLYIIACSNCLWCSHGHSASHAQPRGDNRKPDLMTDSGVEVQARSVPIIKGLASESIQHKHPLVHIAILGWNPGPPRRRKSNIVNAIFGGNHAMLLTECDTYGDDELKEAIEQSSCTYSDLERYEPAIIVRPSLGEIQHLDSVAINVGAKWAVRAIAVKVVLRVPQGNITELRLGSVHVDHNIAKHPKKGRKAIQELRTFVEVNQIDVFFSDFNQAVYARDPEISAFSAMHDVFNDIWIPGPCEGLWSKHETGPCGFVILNTRTMASIRVHKHKALELERAYLGIGPKDTSAHHPAMLWLRHVDTV